MMLKNLKKIVFFVPLLLNVNVNYGVAANVMNPLFNFTMPSQTDLIPTKDDIEEVKQELVDMINGFKTNVNALLNSPIALFFFNMPEIADSAEKILTDKIKECNALITINPKAESLKQILESTLKELQNAKKTKKIDLDLFLNDTILNILAEQMATVKKMVNFGLNQVTAIPMVGDLIIENKFFKKFIQKFFNKKNGKYIFNPSKLIEKSINVVIKIFKNNNLLEAMNVMIHDQVSINALKYVSEEENKGNVIDMKVEITKQNSPIKIFYDKILTVLGNQEMKNIIIKGMKGEVIQQEELLKIFDFYKIYSKVQDLLKEVSALKSNKNPQEILKLINSVFSEKNEIMKFVNSYLEDEEEGINFAVNNNQIMQDYTKNYILRLKQLSLKKAKTLEKMKNPSDEFCNEKVFESLKADLNNNMDKMKKCLQSFQNQFNKILPEIEEVKQILKLNSLNDLNPATLNDLNLSAENIKKIKDLENELEDFFSDDDNKKVLKCFKNKKKNNKTEKLEVPFYKSTGAKATYGLLAVAVGFSGYKALEYYQNSSKQNNPNSTSNVL